jgi:hypothetical protein
MTILTHPEKIFASYKKFENQVSLLWENAPGISFREKLHSYLEILVNASIFKNKKEAMWWTFACLSWPAMDELITGLNEKSFSHLLVEGKFQELYYFLQDNILSDSSSSDEVLHTNFLLKFHLKTLKDNGNKIYSVSPDLQWALKNTELRKYPVSRLRLPFSSIYIDLPSDFKIYNGTTGWHKAEGVYIFEDLACNPRIWRLMLVGKSKNSENEFDDALYYWILYLPENLSIEEALKETFAKFSDRENKYGEQVKIKNEIKSFNRGLSDKGYEHFLLMKDKLIESFKYIMNVIIYSTSYDADSKLCEASKEYRQLKDRAHKASGIKRKELFNKLKNVPSFPRIMLGGNLIINRKTVDEITDNEGKRKIHVRTLVSGHWKTQHFGKGGVQIKDIFVEPYYRGPEYAPLTEKKRVLK